MQPCVRKLVCEATVQLASPHGMPIIHTFTIDIKCIILVFLDIQCLLPRYCRIDKAVDLPYSIFPFRRQAGEVTAAAYQNVAIRVILLEAHALRRVDASATWDTLDATAK